MPPRDGWEPGVPSSSVLRASDVDEYRAAIRPVTPDYIVTGRGRFVATVIKIDFHRLWMQKLEESLPRVRFLETHRAVMFFPATAGSPVTSGGVSCGASEVGFRPPGQPQWQAVSAGSQLCVMSLDPDDLMRIGLALTGQEVAIAPTAMFGAVDWETMARLRRLHAAATQLALTSPEVIGNSHAARGLEELLVEAFVDSLTQGQLREESASLRKRTAIVKRFNRLAIEHSSEPLYLSDICATLGVSRRTLDVYCREQLGIAPKRFLVLRRMHLARGALRLGSPDDSSVTEIATRFGFWELGRFAAAYRSIFGESPSVTLRADPDSCRRTSRPLAPPSALAPLSPTT